MKRTILLLLLLAICTYSFAQNDDLGISITDTVIGKNLLNNTDIKGTLFQFPYAAYNVNVDTVANNILVYFREKEVKKYEQDGEKYIDKGLLIAIDISTRKVTWTKKIETENIYATHDKILFTTRQKKICLNRVTGEQIWKGKKEEYFYVDDNNNIAMILSNDRRSLGAVDLKNGNLLWSRAIDSKIWH